MSINNVEMVDTLIQPPVDSWCRTKDGEEVKFRFAWTIEKFSERPEKQGEFIFSSKFTVQGPDNTKTLWKLQVYPKGSGNVGAKNHLSIFLLTENEIEVKTRFQLSILDRNKNSKNTCSTHKKFGKKSSVNPTNPSNAINNWGFPKVIELSSLRSQSSQLLPNDSLTIVCDLTIIGPEKTVTVSKHREEDFQKDHKLEQLSHDWKNAFLDKELSDVQIHCGDYLEEVFDCHQVVLSARSPVFRVMFRADMTEKKTRELNVIDVDPEIMSELLSYIYTGKCEILYKLPKGKTPKVDTYAKGLLMAAEKYQLEQLKSICEERLCNNIEVGNCLDYLVVGDLYQADILKNAALQFIAKNVESVCETGDWRARLLDYPTLMADVIGVIGRKKVNKSS